jgi:hypothetical protein
MRTWELLYGAYIGKCQATLFYGQAQKAAPSKYKGEYGKAILYLRYFLTWSWMELCRKSALFGKDVAMVRMLGLTQGDNVLRMSHLRTTRH